MHTHSEVRVLSHLSIQCRKLSRAGNMVVLDEKEPAHSKYSRWNDDQAGREQRSGHHGHVDQFSAARDSKWSNRSRQACEDDSIV